MISENDLFYGVDYAVNKEITIHIPTINEILDYGMQNYFELLWHLCRTQEEIENDLNKLGIDHIETDEYVFFLDATRYIHTVDRTQILFGDVDLSTADIDRDTYFDIMNCLRRIHNYDGRDGVMQRYFLDVFWHYSVLYRDFPVSTFAALVRKKIILPKMMI